MSEKDGNGMVGIVIIISIMMITGAVFYPIESNGDRALDDAILSGSIIDDNDSPVDDADIMVVDVRGELLNHTHSNITGNFVLGLEKLYLPTDIFLIIMTDDHFWRTVRVEITEGNNTVDPIGIIPLPEITELVSGSVFHPDGLPVEDAQVRIEYDGPEGRYEDRSATGPGGNFSFSIFPATFHLIVEIDGIQAFDEGVCVVSGEGPYTFDIEVPTIPSKDIMIEGYLTGRGGPVQDAVVGVMDRSKGVGDFARTNASGYYSMHFWGGEHAIVAFREGYDSYQNSIPIGPDDKIWHNITLEEEEYWINGTVRDDRGESLYGITVQFFRAFTFSGSNSDTTDVHGSFSIKVAGGSGYLAAMEGDPFDTEQFEVHLGRKMHVTRDIRDDIVLFDKVPVTGYLNITMDSWMSFSSVSTMGLSLNGSRAGRLFIDSMVGNGDMVLTGDEAKRFREMLMKEDDDLSEGPLGVNTGGNFTLNGLSFDLLGDTLSLDFRNMIGGPGNSTLIELSIASEYKINGTSGSPSGVVELKINGSYRKDNEMREMYIDSPKNWLYIGSSDTLHNISYYRGMVRMIPAADPDGGDDIDHEFFKLGFANNTFAVSIEQLNDISEGEEITFNASVVDHVPDNELSFSWEIEENTIHTSDGNLNHTFDDDGTYDIIVKVTDDLHRETNAFIQVYVSNKDPELEVTAEGGLNRTFMEGETVTFRIIGSDVPGDILFFQWGLQGEWSENLTLDNENSTFNITIPDDGNITVQVRLMDDDGGIAFEEVVFWACNVPPDVSIEISGHSGPGRVDQGKWLTIKANATDMGNDEIFHDWSWPVTDHISVIENGSVLSLRFLEPGEFNITLVVSDDDGGVRYINWTITVIEDDDFDNDGDGMPRWWEQLYGLSDDDPADAEEDPDMDGLTNLMEFENGTRPDSSDTDGDGMPDRYEIETIGLNPLINDAFEDLDGDGISNLEEFIQGTDPTVPEPVEDERDRTGLMIILAALAVLIFAGAFLLIISRKRIISLDDEEE